jgi:hypothetical protein
MHSDLCGSMETRSLTSSYYFLTFIDDARKSYTTIHFLKEKFEVLTYFKQYWSLVIRQDDLSIQILLFDNGGEYDSSAFKASYKDEGMQQHLPFYTHLNKMGCLNRRIKLWLKLLELCFLQWDYWSAIRKGQ